MRKRESGVIRYRATTTKPCYWDYLLLGLLVVAIIVAISGRGRGTRTPGLLVPNQARYQAAPFPGPSSVQVELEASERGRFATGSLGWTGSRIAPVDSPTCENLCRSPRGQQSQAVR